MAIRANVAMQHFYIYLGGKMMEKKFDIEQILPMLNSDDIVENISRLALLMGSPESGDPVKNMLGSMLNQNNQNIESVNTKMQHVDPAINLLLAIKPYLSENRQFVLDESMKALNMSFFMKELKKLT